MNLQDFIFGATFWVLALWTVGFASVVAFSRDLVRSVFALFFTLGGVAGLFVLLGADFLGAVQVILYVGGILVLVIFGVLLTNRVGSGPLVNDYTNQVPAFLICAGVLFLVVSGPVRFARQNPAWTRDHLGHARATESAGAREGERSPAEKVEGRRSTLDIGNGLISTYMVPFELASVVLLVGMLGAASIARKETG